MNDNLPPHVLQQQKRNQTLKMLEEQMQELREIGGRAVVKPESLTMGEIQEIAWGFLMATTSLEQRSSHPTDSGPGDEP